MAITTAQNPDLNLTILIDSNIFIALEDVGDPHHQKAASFSSLAAALGAIVTVSAGTRNDIKRASGAKRKLRQEQLNKYFELRPIPRDLALAYRAGFPTVLSSNDEVDLDVLTTLASGVAEWLVTEDSRLRNRARNAGFVDKVFSLDEVLDTLNSLLNKPIVTSSVETVKGYQFKLDAPIFDDLKSDYQDFEQWWRNKVAREQRDVILLGSLDDPEGLAVLKIETDQPHGLPGKVLKICTFTTAKVHQGSKRGELLLKASIDYARRNSCERIYLEVLPTKAALLNWVTDFGFSIAQEATTPRCERVMVKELVPPSTTSHLNALEFNVAYGPGAIRLENAHIVPIQGRYHRRLFPEAEQQTSLFPRVDACGNAIRKAYLCHARTRQIQIGDTLFFLRTGLGPCVTAVGVAEESKVSLRPEDITAFVGNRTVYSVDEIREMCEKGETLAILFRHDRVLAPHWSRSELQKAGALKGSPQSVQRVRKDGQEWIRQRLGGSS